MIDHHPPMLAEVVATLVVAVHSIATAVVLAIVPPDRAEVMYWTLLPMLGATIASGGAFCFNTQPEVRKIVVGRCLFALFIGVVGPRVMSMIHPWLREIMIDPLLLVGAGFLHGFIAYLMSWPFVRKAYDRAPNVADKQLAAIEQAVDRKVNEALNNKP